MSLLNGMFSCQEVDVVVAITLQERVRSTEEGLLTKGVLRNNTAAVLLAYAATHSAMVRAADRKRTIRQLHHHMNAILSYRNMQWD